jgi:hypothetical protein
VTGRQRLGTALNLAHAGGAKPHTRVAQDALSTCKRRENREKIISGPQPRYWLDLAPLAQRAQRFGQTPWATSAAARSWRSPPWLVMRASSGGPAADTKLLLKCGGRAKRLEVRRHAPSPVARLPCWCLRRGRACRAWARRLGAASRPRAQGQHRLFVGDLVVDTHRQGERNCARTEKARARMHPVVPSPPSAGRSVLESLQQGHTERSGRPGLSTTGLFLHSKTLMNALFFNHLVENQKTSCLIKSNRA